MSVSSNEEMKPPWRVYVTNRPQAVQEEADRYRDEWMAFSADGTRIVAHHTDPLQVAALVKTAGLEAEDVVFAYMPPGGEPECLLPSIWSES